MPAPAAADPNCHRVLRLPVQDRALAAAKRGLADPRLLTDDEIKLVCRTLIFHYAQMGIG